MLLFGQKASNHLFKGNPDLVPKNRVWC